MPETETNSDPNQLSRNEASRFNAERGMPDLILTLLFFLSALVAGILLILTFGTWFLFTVLEPLDTGRKSLSTNATLDGTSQFTRFAVLIAAIFWMIRLVRRDSPRKSIASIIVVIMALLCGMSFFTDGQTVEVITHICQPGTTPDQIVDNPDAHCRISAGGDVRWEIRSDDRTWDLTPLADTPGTSRTDDLPTRANYSEVFAIIAGHDAGSGLVINEDARRHPEKPMSVGRDPDGTDYWSVSVDFAAESTTLVAYFVEPLEVPAPDASITFDVFACPDQNMVSFDAAACQPSDFPTWPIWDDSRILAPPTPSGFREPLGWWIPPAMDRDGNTAVLTSLYARPYRFVHYDPSRRDLPDMEAFTGLIIIPAAESQTLDNDALVRAEPWDERGVLTVEISAEAPEHLHYQVYVLYHDD